MSAQYNDKLDFYRRGPFAEYLRQHRSTGGAPVGMFVAGQPAGEFPDSGTPDLTICIALRADCAAAIDVGAGSWRGRVRSGDITVVASGAPSNYRIEAAHEIFGLSVPSAAVHPAFEEMCSGPIEFGRLHAGPFRDTFVETLCRRMWDEAAGGNLHGSIYVDSAIVVLIAALLRRSEQIVGPSTARGGLAPYRMRRIDALMRDRLADDLGLDDLAREAGLSPFHFARAFKQETGSSPHRYLLERRIERAKELLVSTEQPIVDIARACGFATQAGFTSAFRRVAGGTPGAYRRQ